jgi:hypothetical protein
VTTTKKMLTIALAATALAVGSLGVTGDAFAKGKKGHHHRWHRHVFTSFYDYDPCYWVRTRSGRLIKICEVYPY